MPKPFPEAILGSTTERKGCIPNGTVAGTSAQISMGRRGVTGSGPAGPVLLRKKACHEPRRAVTALGTAALSYFGLDLGKVTGRGEAFYCPDFPARRHRQKEQATANRDV